MGVRELEIWDLVGSNPTCPQCKGKSVVRDAWAKWNGDAREWELKTVFDAMFCDDCGDITPEWQLDSDFRLKRIRRLNDAARRGEGTNVSVVITPGVQALGQDALADVIRDVGAFADFTADNDPHGKHDFGAITIQDQKLFWKIDYFELRCP